MFNKYGYGATTKNYVVARYVGYSKWPPFWTGSKILNDATQLFKIVSYKFIVRSISEAWVIDECSSCSKFRKWFLSPRSESKLQPSDDRCDALTIKLLRLRYRAQVKIIQDMSKFPHFQHTSHNEAAPLNMAKIIALRDRKRFSPPLAWTRLPLQHRQW